jgi:SlyX protein
MTDQRMIDLEIKISHQEMAIEVLQQTFYEQQKTIDRLTETCEKLARRLASASSEGLDIGPANEKPPHY